MPKHPKPKQALKNSLLRNAVEKYGVMLWFVPNQINDDCIMALTAEATVLYYQHGEAND